MSYRRVIAFFAACTATFASGAVWAQNDYKRFFDEQRLPAVREVYQAGRYDLAERVADFAIRRGQPSPEWHVLRMQAIAAQGRIQEATEAGVQLAARVPDDLPVLMAVHDLLAEYGQREKAAGILERVNTAALKIPKNERTPAQLVALGQAALALGADPAQVLGGFFVPAQKLPKDAKPPKPGEAPAYLLAAHDAAGRLAIDKGDYKRAGQEYQKALSYAPNDTDLRFGLARAFFPSDRKKAGEALDRVLDSHPTHPGALMMKAEIFADSEAYEPAEALADRLISVNEHHPLAWAMKSALANLAKHDLPAAEAHRTKALEIWPANPLVDHTIGRILSRNYRFAEGAAHQRKALALDAAYAPAKVQLAHDLLRLGDEDEAWKLAQEIADADQYNILAHNLTLLRDEMAAYRTIETPEFTIRMPEAEAEIYGDRALALLREAREVLCTKYGLDLKAPVLVEFFPHQQDFAIRTFGNLGGAGILGACFGSVVTMNSPGGLAASKNNWEATLWHEFCHVVTLTVTKNKMPRWLSEGISVYEERLRDPRWGQQMTPRYRRLVLEEEGGLTPISRLSSAFLSPKSGEHLMFAYYESMLVVEYLVERFGEDSLRKILKDLGEGVLINDAIARHTEPMDRLEEDFAARVRGLAENLAPGVEWEAPPLAEMDPRDAASVAAYVEKHPKHLAARRLHTSNLLAQQQWEAAADSARQQIALYPADTTEDSGYELLAAACRGRGDAAGERAALKELSQRSGEAYQAGMRLLDLDRKEADWPGLLTTAERVLAINPFQKQAHFCVGCAHEAEGRHAPAAKAYGTLLKLNPPNPSEVRYRLARVLRTTDAKAAKRHLLDSLVDSPRYRDALALLREFSDSDSAPSIPNPAPAPAPSETALPR